MFSILMSVYKNESPNSLNAALNSIKQQTLKHDNFVLVKDGPLTADLDEIILRYKDCLSLDVLELDYNSGLGNALRLGLERCKHEYVIRCDSDDLNHIERFKLLYNSISIADDRVAVIGSFVKEFIGEMDFVSERVFPSCIKTLRVPYRDPVAHPSVIFRKSAVLNVGSYKDCLYFEDSYLWLRLLKENYIILNIPLYLVFMRTDNGFFGRRSGFRYSKFEFSAFRLFYSERLIKFHGLCFGFVRSLSRLLPVKMISSLYFKFLR